MVCQLFFSIQTSIYVAAVYSVLVLLYRIARPNWSLLVFDFNRKTWIPADDHDLDLITGTLIVRVEEAILYPNSTYLYEQIKNRITAIYPKYRTDGTYNDEVIYFETLNQVIKIRSNLSLPSL